MGNSNSTNQTTNINNTLMNDIMIKTEQKMTQNIKTSLKSECSQVTSQSNVVNGCVKVTRGSTFTQSNESNAKLNCSFSSMDDGEIAQTMIDSLQQSVSDTFDMKSLLNSVTEQKNTFFGWASNENSTTNNTNITNSLKNKFANEVKKAITNNIDADMVAKAKQKVSQTNEVNGCIWVDKKSVFTQSNKMSSLLAAVVTQDVINKVRQDLKKETNLDLKKIAKVDTATKSDSNQANLGPEMLCGSYSCFVSIMAIIILVCLMVAMGAMGGGNSG